MVVPSDLMTAIAVWTLFGSVCPAGVVCPTAITPPDGFATSATIVSAVCACNGAIGCLAQTGAVSGGWNWITRHASCVAILSTEEEPAGDFTAEIAEVAKEEKPEVGAALRVENSLEPRNAEVESQEKGTASRIEERSELQTAAVNPGVESAKSIFFGVEAGEGVAGNRPVMPPPEPPRKSSQSEVLVVPKDVERHAGR